MPSNAPRLDAQLGIVWPVTLQLAGMPAEEIGVIPGGNGPERALDELALLLHEWADFISSHRDESIAVAREVQQGVPAAFRRPAPDPDFELIEADAIRAAAASYRKDHPDA